ncbi:hypothetical protein [Amycolatopsis sp. NPDC059657]|uniref:hypothetical protein n=1 Tax=Amycolatopsis sp. NPDC059657 TaxID=3346899 RepID=UPI00366F6989
MLLSTRFKAFVVTVATGAGLLATAAAIPAMAQGVGPGEIIPISNCDGRVEQFTLASDGAIWHRWQSTMGGSFSGWASLGGSLRYGIDVARNADCRLEVFSINSSNQMVHIWQSPATSTGWSGWGTIGGTLVGAPSAFNLNDDRLRVCAYGPDNVWHCAEQSAPSSGPWIGWF